jgi:SAM-dependent methyltransferase
MPQPFARTVRSQRLDSTLGRWFAWVIGVGLWVGASTSPASAAESSSLPGYETRTPSRDGIGRIFQGREISHVMGHEGADWLERPERMQEERPDLLHPLLALKPGMVAADIGAGTGYHSWRMGKAVGPTGKVYAVEIQQEMLDLLAVNMPARGVSNVVGILGTLTDPKLPTNAVDLVLMVDVYHEFDHPYEMLAGIVRSLKPGGRVAFVEFKGEDPKVPIKTLHKMTEAQIRKEAGLHELEWVETRKELPWKHLVIFRRK